MKAKIKPPLFANESAPLKATDGLYDRPAPSHQAIAECAYALWEARGRPDGEDADIWIEAEQKLRGGTHLDSRDDAHFANPDRPQTNYGEASGDIEERLRTFGAPGDRSATSL